jgi:hypothetical protein
MMVLAAIHKGLRRGNELSVPKREMKIGDADMSYLTIMLRNAPSVADKALETLPHSVSSISSPKVRITVSEPCRFTCRT